MEQSSLSKSIINHKLYEIKLFHKLLSLNIDPILYYQFGILTCLNENYYIYLMSIKHVKNLCQTIDSDVMFDIKTDTIIKECNNIIESYVESDNNYKIRCSILTQKQIYIVYDKLAKTICNKGTPKDIFVMGCIFEENSQYHHSNLCYSYNVLMNNNGDSAMNLSTITDNPSVSSVSLIKAFEYGNCDAEDEIGIYIDKYKNGFRDEEYQHHLCNNPCLNKTNQKDGGYGYMEFMENTFCKHCISSTFDIYNSIQRTDEIGEILKRYMK